MPPHNQNGVAAMAKSVMDWQDELSDLRNLIGTAKDELRLCRVWVRDGGVCDVSDYAEAVDLAEAELARLQRLYARRLGAYRSWQARRNSSALGRNGGLR